jgi:coproporphyrinogen III oxidase-like Fe-S oxidoreductase
MDKIKENLAFLSSKTNAHMHIDLIVGLPTENFD